MLTKYDAVNLRRISYIQGKLRRWMCIRELKSRGFMVARLAA